MSELATTPVFACRVCGKPVYVSRLFTTSPDAEAKLLKMLMRGLNNIALCRYHQMQRNYYASQGREEEFMKNALRPDGVIYNVIDRTNLDYYGRKETE